MPSRSLRRSVGQEDGPSAQGMWLTAGFYPIVRQALRVGVVAPGLLELPGCGAVTAAKLLAEIGPDQPLDEGQRGAGYREDRVTVVGPDGAEHDASVYVARAEMIDDSIIPMRSYRDPIVAAARANGLPAEYVDELARTPVADS
jgi:hypothetical protein